jgi:GH15 family glucan-1,4-alpha-glucosidase
MREAGMTLATRTSLACPCSLVHAGPMERRIEDYALLSATNGAALVHRDGTIAWLCVPRFDSEAVFAELLGTQENGSWTMQAASPDARTSRRYRPGTLILETTIETATGRALVIDFMPTPVRGGTHELVRIVRGLEGRVELRTSMRLRFNYGERCPWVEQVDGGVKGVAGPDAFRITAGVELTSADFVTGADFAVSASQVVPFTLEWFPSHEQPPLPRDTSALLAHTTDEWQRWSRGCQYSGPYRDMVERSLVVLKGLTYAPTGGIAAAATTSLPEEMGGSRNWDYRFCWLRDAAFALYAFAASGLLDEAGAWRWWLTRAIGGAPGDVQIMYGLAGERRLTEQELPWLDGFGGSRPVRVGNAAYSQIQHDVYGEVIAAFHAARRAGVADMDRTWPLECALIEHVGRIWNSPDQGIWEVRSGAQHFVHSKVMCWLAFDRMVANAEQFGLDGPIEQWRACRDEIHAEVCAKGFDPELNSFVQFYGSKQVDAALLMIALSGFLPATDPRVIGTVARIEHDLLRNDLVYRYCDSEAVDGVPGDEAAFLACSFWLCGVWIAQGRRDEARHLYEQLLSHANDLGLLAEEYDPVAKRQLGNFPQAFSHVGLVNVAHALAREPGGAWEMAHPRIDVSH